MCISAMFRLVTRPCQAATDAMGRDGTGRVGRLVWMRLGVGEGQVSVVHTYSVLCVCTEYSKRATWTYVCMYVHMYVQEYVRGRIRGCRITRRSGRLAVIILIVPCKRANRPWPHRPGVYRRMYVCMYVGSVALCGFDNCVQVLLTSYIGM